MPITQDQAGQATAEIDSKNYLFKILGESINRLNYNHDLFKKKLLIFISQYFTSLFLCEKMMMTKILRTIIINFIGTFKMAEIE